MGTIRHISIIYRAWSLPQLKKQVAGIILGVFVLALLFDIFTSVPVLAASGNRRQVIMVMLDRVTIDDLTGGRYPNIQRLISAGGLGLMTINTGGDFTDINSYVSIGGGDKFVGSVLTGESFNRDENLNDKVKAIEVYRRNTGHSPGTAEVLNTSIAATLKFNARRYTSSTPGKLGELLHQAGEITAVIGNSDLSPTDEPNRLAASIAMDQWGLVDRGDVSRDLLLNDPKAPYGWRTDYRKLRSELVKTRPSADLIVVETGDTLRVNQSSDRLMKRMIEYHRDRALRQADGFIGSLLPLINRDTMVMLVTPLPQAQALRDGVRLTPLVVAGGGITPGSVLSSPTTRQKGLVANFDIAATTVNFLTGKPGEGMIGLPVEGVVQPGQTEYVKNKYEWLTANSLQRVSVLYYFTRYQWVIYSLVFLQVIFGYYRQKSLARFLLAALLLYPLAILLLPLTGSQKSWAAVILSLLILAVLTYVFTRIRDDLKMYLAIAAANVLVSVVDVTAGGYLMKRALLSYDLVVGGRFYGIGNEYMGVVIGSAILGTAALLQLYPRARRLLLVLTGILFAALIIFFAAPSIGSKAGGALTAMVGFAVAIYRFTGRRVSRRSVFLAVGAVIAGVAVLAVVNYLFPVGEQSHIGRAFNSLFSGDYLAIWQMILRKVTANFYLLQHSPFSTILFLQLLIWGGLFFRNREYLNSIHPQTPQIKAGMTGILFGAAAAIVLNDSGVIGAPLMLNYLMVPLIYGCYPGHSRETQ